MPDVKMQHFQNAVREAHDSTLINSLALREPEELAARACAWSLTPSAYRSVIMVEVVCRGLIPMREGPCPT